MSQELGNAFVKQYYEAIDSSFSLAARFYSKDATVERHEEIGEKTIAKGGNEILALLESAHTLGQTRMEASSIITSNPSTLVSIVQLIGYLSYDSLTARKFLQVFYLTRASENVNFACTSDVLTFLNEPSTTLTSNNVASEVVDAVVEKEPVVEETPVVALNVEPFAQPQQPVSNAVVAEPVAEPEPSVVVAEPVAEPEPEPVKAPEPVKPAAPKSWAHAAAKQPTKTATQAAPKQVAAKPQATKQPTRASTQNKPKNSNNSNSSTTGSSNSGGRQQKSSHRKPDSQRSGAPNGTSDGFKTVGHPRKDDRRRRERDTSKDSQKLFVKGVPKAATQDDLIATFGEFGTIVEVDIFEGNKNVRYANVVFNDSATVEKCVELGKSTQFSVTGVNVKVDFRKQRPKKD